MVSVKEGFPEKKGVRQDGGQLANPRQQELRVLGRGNCLDKLGTLEKERAWNGGRGNLKCIEEWEPSKVPKPGNDAARFNTEKLTQVA